MSRRKSDWEERQEWAYTTSTETTSINQERERSGEKIDNGIYYMTILCQSPITTNIWEEKKECSRKNRTKRFITYFVATDLIDHMA